MDFDKSLEALHLHGPSMRASLRPPDTDVPPSMEASPVWSLEHCWVDAQEEPVLIEMTLRQLQLGFSICCALQGKAILSGLDCNQNTHEWTMVYLLNPSDPAVWRAVESWARAQYICVETPTYTLSAPVSGAEVKALDAHGLEGREMESDMLASTILQLIKDGRLEAEVARQLNIKTPLFCAVVETRMLLQSLQPVNEEEWKMHKEHERNRWVNEGIWS
jgi:hypothetical protein